MRSGLDADSHVLFVCEGTFEQVVVEILRDADAFVMPRANVVGVTRQRDASKVQAEYLDYEYDWPLAIVRVLDSRKERFRLGNLYRARFEVTSVYTRPEAEMLVIINEKCYSDYAKYKSKMKPSEYCIQTLGMSKVKSRKFLSGYWNAESICAAAREYKRLQNLVKDEICLADILKKGQHNK